MIKTFTLEYPDGMFITADMIENTLSMQWGVSVRVREDEEEHIYTDAEIDALRDLAAGELISGAHPMYRVLASECLIERGIPTAKTPWLDNWFVITSLGRKVLEAHES